MGGHEGRGNSGITYYGRRRRRVGDASKSLLCVYAVVHCVCYFDLPANLSVVLEILHPISTHCPSSDNGILVL